jgi:hypothetical protein
VSRDTLYRDSPNRIWKIGRGDAATSVAYRSEMPDFDCRPTRGLERVRLDVDTPPSSFGHGTGVRCALTRRRRK